MLNSVTSNFPRYSVLGELKVRIVTSVAWVAFFFSKFERKDQFEVNTIKTKIGSIT